MKRLFFLLLAALLIMPWGGAGAEQDSVEEFFDFLNLDARDDGGAYTLWDEDGNVLMRTARHVHTGDTWIGMDNQKWEVYEVDGDDAYTRPVQATQDQSMLQRFQTFIQRPFVSTTPVQEGESVERRIGVYNSHGAEAYVPDDGTDSKEDGGGILNVADSLRQGLEENDVDVVQSKETHVPHDAGAYKRSRNTVEEIMGEGVDAVIDVHRDAIAAEEYQDEAGQVQVQLVVGRQNQNQAANQQFAEELKAAADEQYPGLVKGIFSAQGNYNQDMSPRSMLIEVGTHETEKSGAQEAASKFGDVLATYLYGTAAAAEDPAATAQQEGTAWTSIFWILAAVIVGAGVFLYISAGSWPEMKRKLKGFTRGEFGDIFNSRRLKNRDDE